MFVSSKISLKVGGWLSLYPHVFRHMLISRNVPPQNFTAISPKKDYKQNQFLKWREA